MSLCTVTWEMKNGLTLCCVYPFHYTPASYWEPADSDLGEPTYYIDGDEIEYANLPRGLDRIADLMYEGSIGTMDEDHTDGSMDDGPDPDDFICDRFYDGN